LDLKHYLEARLVQLLREEEVKWYQRSKTDSLLKGDSNTKYFQLIANGKHRKTRIFQPEEGDQVIKGDENMKTYITKYYKRLFRSSNHEGISLNEDIANDIAQVSVEDNEMLTTPFTENEVKEAIFEMKHNKAPGPDGFPAEFYQRFWKVIKYDLMALFKEFHDGTLALFHLNYGVITLLPKQKEFTNIK
jgi:hypothetical protein